MKNGNENDITLYEHNGKDNVDEFMLKSKMFKLTKLLISLKQTYVVVDNLVNFNYVWTVRIAAV